MRNSLTRNDLTTLSLPVRLVFHRSSVRPHLIQLAGLEIRHINSISQQHNKQYTLFEDLFGRYVNFFSLKILFRKHCLNNRMCIYGNSTWFNEKMTEMIQY